MSDPSNIILLVAVSVIVVAMLLMGQFAYYMWNERKEGQQRELARRLGTLQETEATPLIRFGASAGPSGIMAWLDELLRQAGSPYTMATLLQRVLLASVVGVAVGFVLFRGPMAMLGALAGAMPLVLLNMAASSRTSLLTEQLPDGLDLLARSLQAGHGIGESLRLVSEEMPEPLASEFGRVFEEQNLGRDTRECFQNLCRRNPRSFDLRIFVSSVLLQRDTGGNLVEILQNIAHTIRERFVFQGKVSALTSEARFTGFILGGLPFAIATLISIFAPTYITPLFTDPMGHLLLLIGATMFSVGVFVMVELAKVDI